MKKIIAALLVLGFTMPVMAADMGEQKDDQVKCEEIFQGSEAKSVAGQPGEESSSGSQKDGQK